MKADYEYFKIQDKLDYSAFVNFDVKKGYSLKENAPQDIVDAYNAYKEYWKNKNSAA